jgi:hypothetical protein
MNSLLSMPHCLAMQLQIQETLSVHVEGVAELRQISLVDWDAVAEKNSVTVGLEQSVNL